MGFPTNPRATTFSPVLFLPRWSAGVHLVTDVSLLVIHADDSTIHVHRAWHRPGFLYAGGEFRRLTCTHPQPLPATGHDADILDVYGVTSRNGKNRT
jgi:hypothetical protein